MLSLVDATVEFRNGDDRDAMTCRIEDLDELVAMCLADDVTRSQVRNAVLATLSSVLDHQNREQSLLETSGSSPRVDVALRSAFDHVDSQHRVVRSIDVPGIVVDVETRSCRPPGRPSALLLGLTDGGRESSSVRSRLSHLRLAAHPSTEGVNFVSADRTLSVART